jgi:hypothetical protein
MGSTSFWAFTVDRGLTVINDENIEVRRLKDKEVVRLAEYEKKVENEDCRTKTKDVGCRKLPLFFGPTFLRHKNHKVGELENKINARRRAGRENRRN